MIHTVAHHMPYDEDRDESDTFLCVCGEMFWRSKDGNWDSSLEQMAAHLKEKNAVPESLLFKDETVRVLRRYEVPKPTSDEQIFRDAVNVLGNNDPKPEKPEGDDPRAGNLFVSKPRSSNAWRRILGLKER